MRIYLSETGNSKSRFTFPALPERIKVEVGTRYLTYEIIGKGSVKVPHGLNAGTISWSGIFFGKEARNKFYTKPWASPAKCKKVLNRWMEKGTVLRLLVTGTSINYDVTISNFTYEEFGAQGSVEYTISFVINKELKIYTTKELKIATFVKKTVPRAAPAEPATRTYVVVSGDTLWRIAQQHYGSGAEWPRIYDANAGMIENVANGYRQGRGSDHGHWIYPGTTLSIP